MRNTKKLTMVAMMIALSVVFHTVEGMVWNPAEFVVPGFKLGLANIVGLIALFKFDSKTMITVNFMRVMISSLLTGTILGHVFWLSLSGVVLSTAMAILLHNKIRLSPIGVSIGASAFHCIGQILMAVYLYNQIRMIFYLPVLLLLSVPTGIVTGIISQMVVKRLK